MTGYDDRDGFIWMDGKLVDWRGANVHILTHALHYASAVFEGERCYNGKIFKSREHSARLRNSDDKGSRTSMGFLFSSIPVT